MTRCLALIGVLVVASGCSNSKSSSESPSPSPAEDVDAKAAAVIKKIEEACLNWQADHGTYPSSLEQLEQPDKTGKSYLRDEEMVFPWRGAKLGINFHGSRGSHSRDGKPDISVANPTGGYMICNWQEGRVPLGK